MTETEEKLAQMEQLFDKLRPFIVLAINDYYFGKDRESLKQKMKELGYDPEN